MLDLVSKIIFVYRKKYDRIRAARAMGVRVGNQCRLISFPNFGSEPYLIEIGDHVTISDGVTFVNHDGGTWVFREIDPYKEVIKFGKIRIGNNCFIGTKSVIMPGVEIGDNCVVGACSLVTKSIPAGEVWGGTGALHLKNCRLC